MQLKCVMARLLQALLQAGTVDNFKYLGTYTLMPKVLGHPLLMKSLERTLFYSNMTVSLCIRQVSKINDDSVSVEELDWSAESQVTIPDEHFWCDFKCRP